MSGLETTATDWHTLSADEALRELGSSRERGLSSEEAAQRLAQYGPNVIEEAPVLRMPVFFLLGRRDRWVPPETSVAYFDMLTAPRKELVWFEESGHEPFVDEPAKFNATMAGVVRPAVGRSPSD